MLRSVYFLIFEKLLQTNAGINSHNQILLFLYFWYIILMQQLKTKDQKRKI